MLGRGLGLGIGLKEIGNSLARGFNPTSLGQAFPKWTQAASATDTPAFDPSVLTGLWGWWRADKGVTIGTGVSTWADQSGAGDANRNLTQATGSKQPTLNASDAAYNNQKTLSFAAASVQCLQGVGNASVSLTPPFTVYIIGNDDNAASSEGYVVETDGSVYYLDGTAGGKYDIDANVSIVSTKARSTSPTLFAMEYKASPAASTMRISEHSVESSGAITAYPSGTITMKRLLVGGITTGANLLNGKIAEIVVAGAAYDSRMEAYVTSRYGISIGA